MVKKIDYFSLFARIAIALGFLSAVADRLGLWTPLLGSENVVWGNMKSFTAYTGVLLPCVPKILLPLFAWAATIAEIILGILLLIGFQKRLVALLSGILLLTFAFSMLFSLNIKAPLDYSVFAATACAFLLYKENGTKISPASQRTSRNAI
ncbi:DoxX protein [Odoribacter sp. AF15-53]|uniref:DoxX protein n=1 Tax=Odoribacter sp. AF15-53 TaxID=2292236 RepID=UPI000E49AD01|nr:DoxX protein [Odoribacter sp. AF15-53]RHR82780.1 DoxX protein [Odoribacter sp. AF15-53]